MTDVMDLMTLGTEDWKTTVQDKEKWKPLRFIKSEKKKMNGFDSYVIFKNVHKKYLRSNKYGYYLTTYFI